MKITLSPVRGVPGQPGTVLSVSGDVLTIDGTAIDFAPLVPDEGGFVPDPGDHPLLGLVTRRGGEIEVTVRYVLDDGAAPVQPSQPEHWCVQVIEGDVVSPALPAEIDEEDQDQ